MNRQTLIWLATLFCSVLPGVAGDKPVILGPVRNGASFDGFVPSPSDPSPRFGRSLAGGSIFVLFGEGLGPTQLVHGKVPYSERLPAGPGGTGVTFRSLVTDEVFPAYLIHSWQSQVSGIVPSQLPVGLAEVTVSYDGVDSDLTLVEISEFAPALFTTSQAGRRPAVAQNYESAVSQPLNSLTHPAAPGQYLVLWATGLGPIDSPDNVRRPVGNLRNDLSVRFSSGAGEVEVPAEYAGRSPQFPGVDQINVRIPDDGSIDLGCYQELGLQIGIAGFGSLGTVAISDTPTECEHPWGLSAQRLRDLEAGGRLTFLHLYLGNSYAHATVANADATGVASNSGNSGQRQLPPYRYVCSPAQFIIPSVPPGEPTVVPLRPGLFVADPGLLRLVGPDLRAVQLVRSPYYADSFEAKAHLPADFFLPGEWTLRSGGGKDVASFETAFRIKPLPPIDLPASISQSDDLEFSWDPSAYEPAESISISLQEANPGQTTGNALLCNVPATVGSLKIRAGDIESLEAEVGSKLRWQMTLYPLGIAFTAPGLDHGGILAQPGRTQEAVVIE